MKMTSKYTLGLACLVFSGSLLISCSSDDDTQVASGTDEEETVIETADGDFETPDWTTATHAKDADPNFDEVFDDTSVKRMDIVITTERWQSMLDDMTATYGTFGSGGGGGLTETDENPIYVPAEVFYEGKQWYRVGVRFKGNSSLQRSWSDGNLKLSFKLDFDEFEDEYPQIDNQRFYGFKKMSLKNNFDDHSFLREKVAGDLFRASGLAGSHTAFYTVYVDHGDGPQYFGLYTLTEEVDDTVIETQFSEDSGNLYKPDGDGASFMEGSFDADDFVKKSNEEDSDWSDIQSLFTVLHDSSRTTDAASWRTALEAIFDTDVFLKYLAVNTVIQNWDTYGRMTHNYFLYRNPTTNKLTWIPWDNNEALKEGNRQGALALDFSDLDTVQWPLIGYLYADTVYKAKYDGYVQEFINGPFEVSTMQSLYANYQNLISPYATAEEAGYTFLNSSSDFQSAISELNTHVSARASAVNAYLE